LLFSPEVVLGESLDLDAVLATEISRRDLDAGFPAVAKK
jgi:hypothetical protein